MCKVTSSIESKDTEPEQLELQKPISQLFGEAIFLNQEQLNKTLYFRKMIL